MKTKSLTKIIISQEKNTDLLKPYNRISYDISPLTITNNPPTPYLKTIPYSHQYIPKKNDKCMQKCSTQTLQINYLFCYFRLFLSKF